MGRPEPCVLFAQTFVHAHLDEYVDEVLFAEPVVISACEFLEQNASSASQSVTLVGATSPPSFALEVFVQCEGESRFRRLCQPFLYSHSSSNVLDVEAVVTNHLVVRGSYRSLSLVVYGNTAEDLGQFNIEFDDSSLTNIVSSVEGDLEDLPLPLRSIKFMNDKFSCSLHALSVPVSVLDISLEVKQLLQLILKLLQVDKSGGAVQKAVNTVVSTASVYIVNDSSGEAIHQKSLPWGRAKETAEFQNEITQCRKELIEHYKVLQQETGDTITESFQEFPFLESDCLPSTKQLVDMLGQYFQLGYESPGFGHPSISKSNNVKLWLGTTLFLCSSKESCFHFVNSGGVEQLNHVLCHDLPKSTTAVLLLLGVLEQATRHSVGCDRFLGWWPREDEKVPSRISVGYSQLLRLLLEKPRHDVASLASYILRRLRAYEVLSRYECAVLSALGHQCTDDGSDSSCQNFLFSAKSQLKNLMKLLNTPGSVEDPSLVALASRSLMLGQSEGGLSYKATSGLITSSNSCLFNWDNNLHLLALLKERGFWPLTVALLSLSTLQSEVGNGMFLNMEIVTFIGAILFSLLRSRSGLLFLAQQAELSDALIEALKGADSAKKEDCLPLRYASTLISKGFLFVPREIGMILEMHLRVVNMIDHLLTSTPHSEEFLLVLWELCAFSRSECGRKALLIIGYFPEAVSALIEALRSVKEPEPAPKNAGASPLDVAIFHSAAEIFELIVTDSMASSLGSWIGYAAELHGALHSSSPGSNRKDAPTRLLEWIDAGVVYHKNGAIGLLRYVAVLASGGDAHLTSTSVLVSDLMDVDHGIGDPSGGSEINVMENLGKIISEKTFDGVVLRDSAIAQLTTAFRILAFISENSMVASELYHEGAIPVVYAVLVNCRFMLERSSNSYDYLVDDGTECNSTSDLLLERNREQSLVDLLVPTMVLLVSLLQKLQEAHEQHRNTKLMNALLRLHKEISPKLAACAADLSSPYPDSALGFEAVCHLVVSALAYWPVSGWTPGLFHSLLTNVQATSALSLGPKEICSLLCVLNDLFPDEGIWLWKNGMPALSALRTLAIGSILGPQKEKEVNWYLKPEHREKVLGQLRPHLDKIAKMVQHCAISALVVIQDMLRVFIVRIACQKFENASVFIRPILSWVLESVDLSCQSEMDAYKMRRYLDFLASLLEHPQAKALLLKEGIVDILQKVLERCLDAIDSGGSDFLWAGTGFTIYSWCLSVLKSISLICGSGKSEQYSDKYDLQYSGMSSGDCGLILPSLLKCFQVLPYGKELLACVGAFEGLGSSAEGRRALLDTFFDVHSKTKLHDSDKGQERQQISGHNELRWMRYPPLLCCWKKLWSSFVSRDGDISGSAVEGLKLLSTGCFYFCRDGKGLDLKGVSAVKYLFGLSEDTYTADGSLEENMNYIKGVATFLSSKVTDHDHEATATATATATPTFLFQVLKSAELLLSLLQKPDSDINTVDVSLEVFPSSDSISPKFHIIGDTNSDKADDILLSGGLVDKFQWDCPETLPDKTVLPMKRKLSSVDATGRRGRAESVAADSTAASGTFSRGSGPPVAAPAGPTRRDTFRLRKPNTSRPPSMHVDDYVARERNTDGGSDVIAIPRGPTSGRPPSIHVDEFMARQRERQSSSATVVGEAVAQVKNAAAPPLEKVVVDKQKQLKTDIDDDLQGIDIVFDGEESETDDKLPFLHMDENLQQQQQQPAPIENSPRSIVEETESDTHGSGQFSRMGTPTAASNAAAADEISSRMSASRIERALTREPSVTSDKKFDQPSSGYYSGMYNSGPPSSSGRARMSLQTSYPKQSPQYQGNLPYSVAPYDPRFMQTQPPLPPMPPPPSLLSQSDSQSNTSMDGQQQPIPAAFQVQQDYMSTYNNSPIRPLPPLPPTPPPFLTNPYNLKAQNMQSAPYGQTNVPYPPTPIMPSMIYNNRPQSSSYMTSSMQQQQQSENPLQSHLSAVQTMHQLQPLQPPLLPPQPPHHHLHRPLVRQSSDQGFLGQSSSGTVQGSSLQMMQQQPPQFAPPPPPVNTFYQSQQPESSSSHAQQQSFQQVEQQQKDAGISLADYFKSPEDIQALLSDREKLCQLLEQHPKLMQMLQEKLGQL